MCTPVTNICPSWHKYSIAHGCEQLAETPNPNLFETLVDAIISQQISVKAADAIMARLRAAVNGVLITPEALLLLDDDALRAVGLSPQKIRYMHDLTERVSSGQLNLEQLSELDDVQKSLTIHPKDNYEGLHEK